MKTPLPNARLLHLWFAALASKKVMEPPLWIINCKDVSFIVVTDEP